MVIQADTASRAVAWAVTNSVNTYFPFSQGYHSGIYGLFSGSGSPSQRVETNKSLEISPARDLYLLQS
jgi:hypothetical protein